MAPLRCPSSNEVWQCQGKGPTQHHPDAPKECLHALLETVTRTHVALVVSNWGHHLGEDSEMPPFGASECDDEICLKKGRPFSISSHPRCDRDLLFVEPLRSHPLQPIKTLDFHARMVCFRPTPHGCCINHWQSIVSSLFIPLID